MGLLLLHVGEYVSWQCVRIATPYYCPSFPQMSSAVRYRGSIVHIVVAS